MHINTQLTKQDYINAYKEMCGFLIGNPFLSSLLIAGGILVDQIPFALFPLKMAALALVVSFSVCLISTRYLNGSLSGLKSELHRQQRIFLPVAVLILCLSWLGFVVADSILVVLKQPGIIQPHGISPLPAAEYTDSATILGALLLATLVGIAQIMPLALAHFCNGLNLSKRQGEHIWMALMTQAKTFLAFLPLGQIGAVGLLLQIDTTVLLVVSAAVYSTFVLFIVFNLEPKERESLSVLDVAEQAG